MKTLYFNKTFLRLPFLIFCILLLTSWICRDYCSRIHKNLWLGTTLLMAMENQRYNSNLWISRYNLQGREGKGIKLGSYLLALSIIIWRGMRGWGPNCPLQQKEGGGVYWKGEKKYFKYNSDPNFNLKEAAKKNLVLMAGPLRPAPSPRA